MRISTSLLLSWGTATAAVAVPLLAAATPAPRAPAPGPAARVSEADAAFFESRVRPLLVQRCQACHSAKLAQGGLRVDDRESFFRGGDAGPLVDPGKPEESRLLRAVGYADPHLQMPPSGKLPAAELAVLTDWVKRGAPWPAPAAPAAGAGKPLAGMSVAEGKRFWAFRPLARKEPAPAKRTGWAARRIDAYLLAAMEAKGLAPSPPADRRTLLRRVTFDLTGLPPTPEELEAFAADPSPKAYEQAVERLLASPAYGERWGRHWLDLVRYCDVPEVWAMTEAQPWLYRDWVVRAINQDLPYDRFVKLQLAADELPGTDPADLAALGFLGLSPSYWKELKLAPDVIKTVVAEEWEERIGTVSGALMGLTVACARCHDHKYDPVTQADYYALAGIFASTRLAPRPLLPEGEARAVLAARQKVKDLEAEAKRLQEAAAKDAAKAPEMKQQAQALLARAEETRRATPHFEAPMAYAVETAALHVLPDGPDRTRLDYREGTGQDVAMQLRGNPAKEGSTVPRRFLSVLSPAEPPRFTRGSGRGDLAETLFREGAPLSARVMVNRVWRHHFGKGLVETPSNFGVTGDRPTHPELLEDLAARFIQNGWSLKWLHREIVLSAAYRQASRLPAQARPAGAKDPQVVDPDNRFLWRMNPRRLEVEAWRDAILAAAGTLDPKLGGPAQELSAAQNVRRTLYGVVRRRELDDLLRLYDFPDPTTHSPARFPTTTPLQQLYLLNSEFIGRSAAALAARVRKEAGEDAGAQVRRAHLLLYGRLPTERELTAAREFLGEGGAERWQELAEVLLARNELAFVD